MKFTTLLVVSVTFTVLTHCVIGADFCWKDSYGRGAGVPLSTCASSLVKDGALCYPACKANYRGVGPVCWANCPAGMTDAGTTCTKKSYGRGAGRPVNSCPSGMEKDGALCYPVCRANFAGTGPVCWSKCPGGFSTFGAFCLYPVEIYPKSCCCTIFGCCNNCKAGYTDDGCTCRKPGQSSARSSYGRGAGVPMGCTKDEDLNGGLCYPKCQAGYTGVGPVCYQNCAGDTTDAGATCTKKSYGRTAGVPMICKATEQQDAGLCYTPCKSGYNGVGPVCWGGCPTNWTQCGAACGKSQSDCAGKIINMVQATAEMVANIAGFVTGVGGAAKIATNVADIASKVSTTATVASKLNDLVTKIIAAAAQNNQTITQDDAKTQAQNELAGVMLYQQNKGQTPDLLNSTWDLLAKVDPTGILGAAKAFYFPLCSAV